MLFLECAAPLIPCFGIDFYFTLPDCKFLKGREMAESWIRRDKVAKVAECKNDNKNSDVISYYLIPDLHGNMFIL